MLKKQIGIDAGVIWQLLQEKGKLSMRQIGEQSNLSSDRILLATGWLAREDKIVFTEDTGTIYAELKPVGSQYYF